VRSSEKIWEPPYIVPATLEPKLHQIFPADNFIVTIEGVVIATVCPRQVRAA
jgi:hypothetical protein